jgi:hypothetical protein
LGFADKLFAKEKFCGQFADNVIKRACSQLKSQKAHVWNSGLPDGIFSDQKFQFGYNMEDLGKEKKFIYFMTI